MVARFEVRVDTFPMGGWQVSILDNVFGTTQPVGLGNGVTRRRWRLALLHDSARRQADRLNRRYPQEVW